MGSGCLHAFARQKHSVVVGICAAPVQDMSFPRSVDVVLFTGST
jgi:hypothetical protein